jgi:hypothetical protein
MRKREKKIRVGSMNTYPCLWILVTEYPDFVVVAIFLSSPKSAIRLFTAGLPDC